MNLPGQVAGVVGSVPVEVRVYCTDGSEAWEYGRDAVILDGELNIDFTVARNDPAGDWRVEARELCAGTKASTALRVAAPAEPR